MKLLILTQIIDEDDSVLGFFHDWVLEFSKEFELVTVVCLKSGKYDFPENVAVESLGKERGESDIKYLFNFYKNIFLYRRKYDAVFVHMTQLYVILGFLFWKLLNKKIYLWYAHGKTSFSLIMAEKMVEKIFTSSQLGFRLITNKKILSDKELTQKYF